MLQVKVFVFSPFQENTYVVYNQTGLCFIIDPGCYFDAEKETLKSFIELQGLKPVALLNTHCHLDHVFGNKFIAETYGLTLHLHRQEEQVLQFAPSSGLMWNIPFDNYQGEFTWLQAGDKLQLGTDELLVLEAPGHSPGHICFYCEAQHFLIGGDVLFKGSIGRTDLPGGDLNTLLHSIRTQLFTLPNNTVVYNGHGEPTTIGEEKTSNPYLQQCKQDVT
jgi:glyoxylase-like metal-dependent hydrolase (beta-lactamase superfamily II)